MPNQNYGVYNFPWIRGSTEPLIIKYEDNGVPLTFDDARLSVYAKNPETGEDELLWRLTYADSPGTGPGTVAHDIVTGEITFHPTAAQTRLLKQSRINAIDGSVDSSKGKNRYEVELRDGPEEHIYLLGNIAGIGGYNDDEEIVP